MLINTVLKIGEVITIKLLSGEEILGRLAEGTDETLVWLNRPMTLMFNNEIHLIPFMFTADGERVPIRHQAIASITSTSSTATMQYIRSTTSLELPS